MNNIIKLQHDILWGMNGKPHTLCIFFDMKKACEKIWRQQIIRQLIDWNLGGNVVHFI